jgi:pSer/pThr/pTyr-binding forkhead associated (FHA) protein
MPPLRLTICIRDLRDDVTFARSFVHSPVIIGRGDGVGLTLESDLVSRTHGAFIFTRGVLRYVDFDSTNGTRIDGTRIDADQPVDVTDTSVVRVGPFQMLVHLDLILSTRGRGDGAEPVSNVNEARATMRDVRPSLPQPNEPSPAHIGGSSIAPLVVPLKVMSAADLLAPISRFSRVAILTSEPRKDRVLIRGVTDRQEAYVGSVSPARFENAAYVEFIESGRRSEQ